MQYNLLLGAKSNCTVGTDVRHRQYFDYVGFFRVDYML